MKKILYFSTLCMIWIASSGGCNGRQCDLVCQNGGVLRVNDDNCYCDCPPGYSGYRCENTTNTNKHRLHAVIDTTGGPTYTYDPADCFVHVYDHATDTLWIDGFDTLGTQDGYCFLRLYIDDHTTITNGSSFPVRIDNSIGSCWASYKVDGSTDAYGADPSKVGYLTINVYIPGTVISGTFDFYAKNGASSAHITGWFEDYD